MRRSGIDSDFLRVLLLRSRSGRSSVDPLVVIVSGVVGWGCAYVGRLVDERRKGELAYYIDLQVRYRVPRSTSLQQEVTLHVALLE